MYRFNLHAAAFVLFFAITATHILAQDAAPTADDVAAEVTGETDEVDVAKQVEVDPINSDEKIANRLREILAATGWFIAADVEVDRGVAFLSGEADSQKHADWAEATAMNTSDVVAVVNQLNIADKPLWNFAPAMASVKQLGRDFTSVLPLFVIATLIGIISYYTAIAGARLTRWIASHRIDSKLLRQVVGRLFHGQAQATNHLRIGIVDVLINQVHLISPVVLRRVTRRVCQAHQRITIG